MKSKFVDALWFGGDADAGDITFKGLTLSLYLSTSPSDNAKCRTFYILFR